MPKNHSSGCKVAYLVVPQFFAKRRISEISTKVTHMRETTDLACGSSRATQLIAAAYV